MILSLYFKIERFVKGLPIIRDIPSFSSLPPNLPPENLRFYKLCNLVHTLGWAVHAAWIFLFWYLEIYTMVYINIVSVAIYIFNIVINRKGYHFTSTVIMIAEIIAHQIIAVKFFGLDAGFQYYIVVTTIFPFLMPKGQWIVKGIFLAAGVLTFILLDYLFRNYTPVYALPPGFVTFFRISNIAGSIISMCISGAYFAIAMHETEAELAQKTDALVEAEKDATLGKLATEMAHEIQNPLNFVNNFSEINEELFLEIKTELEKSGSNEEALEILCTLMQNNERVRTNGQRVSKIVRELQERANKLQAERKN